MKTKIERYEIYNIDPKVKMKVKLYCVKNNITAGEFIKLAYETLTK